MLEYANRFQERGHSVFVVYPVIPSSPRVEWHNLKKTAAQVLSLLMRLKQSSKVGWFPLKARLKRVPYFPRKYRIPIIERYIPDSDIILATEGFDAYFVNNLPERKGVKFQLLQHYEVWDLWNQTQLWDEAEKIESNPFRLPLAVANINTNSYDFHKVRELVDTSYRLPLHKITTSSWLATLLEEKFNQKVDTVIVSGVNLAEFFADDKRYNKKKRILMLYHPPIIRWKGTEDGIRAFEIARERHPEIQLVMFGSRHNANIPDYAEFHERPFGEEVRRLYFSCDVFVCPSWVEGGPLPPMEAMACKCAVATTNVGAVPDYTIPGETALVSPPRRPELLAENIIKLVESDGLLRRISEAGYEHIKKFNWDRATDALEQTFNKALSNSQK